MKSKEEFELRKGTMYIGEVPKKKEGVKTMKKIRKVRLILADGTMCDYTKYVGSYHTDSVERCSKDIAKAIMGEDVLVIKEPDDYTLVEKTMVVMTKHIVGITVEFMEDED